MSKAFSSKMNWSFPSNIPAGTSLSLPSPLLLTPAQALTTVIESVNCLIPLLRTPGDTSVLRTGEAHLDLTRSDQDRLLRHVSDALAGFRTLAVEYKAPSVNSILPSRSEPKFTLPLTHPPPSVEVKKEEEPLRLSRYLNMSGEVSDTESKPVEIEPDVNSDCIQEGLEFDSLEEAEAAFDEYATRAGFTICKGNSKKDVYQEFACSSRGKRRERKVPDITKRRNRNSIKSMCRCHVILRKKDDKWQLSTRRLTHTHKLLEPDEVLRTSKHRQIPEEIKQRAIAEYQKGETPARIQNRLVRELGAACTWSMKDLYNTLYRFKTAS